MDFDLLPVIVLNGGDSETGRIFTLLHELARLVRRTAGVCAVYSDLEEERQCNRIAAAVLMPEPFVRQVRADAANPEQACRQVARQLRVSTSAAAIRLVELRLADPALVTLMRDETERALSERHAQQREAEGGPAPWRVKLRNLGEPYAAAVIEAMNEERITYPDAVRLMGAKLKMIDQISSGLSESA